MALSGRSLACAARRAGYSCAVLDLFADRDTRRCARTVTRVAGRDGQLVPGSLLRAAARLGGCAAPGALLYGSGVEHDPALLARLARGRRVLGNPAEVVSRVRSPERFFGLLQRLGIPYPETRFQLPPASSGWLSKSAAGCGGGHVQPLAAGRAAAAGDYYQRFVGGRTLSVLFLANGRDCCPVGFHEQWTANQPDRPYLYAGAVTLPNLWPPLERRIRDALAALVRATGLVGLCGLDFILDRDMFYVLEINPRPPATFELHDAVGLLRAHLRACAGGRPLCPPEAAHRARSHCHLYAHVPVRIPPGWIWPSWTADQPASGTAIPRGQPICTVFAEARDAPGARHRVTERAARLRAALESLQEAA